MVCIPCIVIPLFLWIFHKFIQPYIIKFWNPWKKTVKEINLNKDELESKSYAYIQKRIAEEPVMVFSKTACGYCDMVKDVFAQLKVKYAIDEIDKRDDTDKLQDLFLKMTGERTLPRVFINGKCIGGGTDTYTLHNESKLLPMLQEAKASFASD